MDSTIAGSMKARSEPTSQGGKHLLVKDHNSLDKMSIKKVLNITFKNISVIALWQLLLGWGVTRNHPPSANPDKISYEVILKTLRHEQKLNSHNVVEIDIDCIDPITYDRGQDVTRRKIKGNVCIYFFVN